MLLTENKMKSILKEEYDKRIASILLERIQFETSNGIPVWDDAFDLKVIHDESGVIFTFCCIEDERVKLLMPYESRESIETTSLNLIPEIDNYIKNDEEENDYSEEDKDYIYVDIKVFEREFSRA